MRPHFIIYVVSLFILSQYIYAQQIKPLRIPDTGQTGDYTQTFGEDSDYQINTPSYRLNGNGTVTDLITGLMWQSTDAGEMLFENAVTYCDTLTLAGYTDWRLPTAHELYTILNQGKNRPAADTAYFKYTLAEYWWSSDKQIDDVSKIWSCNAGGGIGAHAKTETISAGGTRRFHTRAVRYVTVPADISIRFVTGTDGTVTDKWSGLTWTVVPGGTGVTWENALTLCENYSAAGFSDWRLPTIKELQSLNNERTKNPSFDSSAIRGVTISNYWSSTTLFNQNTRAWYINTAYGLITYDDKTKLMNVLAVRGISSVLSQVPETVLLPAGDFSMGDHHGYIDPQHPSDELPLHNVHIDSFYIGKYELTNAQFCEFLNSAYTLGSIRVQNNNVYAAGDTNLLCYTYESANYCSISFNGSVFSIIDFRALHPVVGIMWFGAAAYCNWLSSQKGLTPCYTLSTGVCDFTKPGYRLPTEAEWEYAGRGGEYNPYYVFPFGNDSVSLNRANWPSSGDPYETGNLPYTTPVGFYNGQLRLKTEFNWPGTAVSYQTLNGYNSFGLADMSGNVWEFVNDWYGQNYYSSSPVNNPKGPTSGFIMPDGKPYRGMRGGNWYNGQWGHSRVANRNPSYYRGPQDPNHPWYHIGFRVAQNFTRTTGIEENNSLLIPQSIELLNCYPNPFNPVTAITVNAARTEYAILCIYSVTGERITTLFSGELTKGLNTFTWNASGYSSGIYFAVLHSTTTISKVKLCLIK